MGSSVMPCGAFSCYHSTRAAECFPLKLKSLAASRCLVLGSQNMIAGNRKHVREARNVHGLIDRRGDGVAFAGDERGGYRTLVAGNDRADALVDPLAHAIDGRGIGEPEAAVGGWCCRLDSSKHKT